MASSPSRSAHLPAPVGGWDTREALADMPAKNAVILDNWFPTTDKCILRRGSASHATGMSGNVESLLPYVPLSGTGKLFAANGGNIYDVSSAGAVGAAAVSGLSNNRFQHAQLATAAGQFLFTCNGADTPRVYDGASWSASGITGPTLASVIWCNVHQRRLWIGETGSLDAWYLAVNSIAGAATNFALGGLAKRGGYLVGMGTWTIDAGDGIDDKCVFLTSEGEAIVYQGTDPSSASTWGLEGVYSVGKPIGRRCMIKAAGDLLILTQDGAVFASQALRTDTSQTEKIAVTGQINRAFTDAVRDYGSTYGWEPIIYPRGTMLILNIPQANSEFHQYAFNTLTKAPCRFTGMNAICWGLMNDKPYFGSTDGKVYEFDTGTGDAGSNIEADALQSFNSFGSPGTVKAFKRAEPIFESDGNPNAALDLCVDYEVRTPTGVTNANPVSSALWGISHWGVGTWGTNGQIYRGWRAVRGMGRTAAIRIRVNTNSARPAWVATNYLYTLGGQR
jgi:hypothetical protein